MTHILKNRIVATSAMLDLATTAAAIIKWTPALDYAPAIAPCSGAVATQQGRLPPAKNLKPQLYLRRRAQRTN
jgi:hypothetical protein